MENDFTQHKMVQFGVWPNCCNNCDFCLRVARIPVSKEKQIEILRFIKENIKYIDWENEYSYGISLLGGELYYITDREIQDEFLSLVDVIIERILKVSKNPQCRYSTVTNGLYEPSFLYRVVDKIRDSVGIEKVDLNFSYDLKYRYQNDDARILVENNINEFHRKYNYRVGVQMILTQYLIDMWKDGRFDIVDFRDQKFPGNNLCFLYPHPINTGKVLDDFNFNRKDFLKFIRYMQNRDQSIYRSFIFSTMNSARFKWTGYKFRDNPDTKQQPVLCDGKEILTSCGHSVLYRCYSDCDKCMMCDLEQLEGGHYL